MVIMRKKEWSTGRQCHLCTLGLPHRVFRCFHRQRGPSKHPPLVGWGLAGCLADVGSDLDSTGEWTQEHRTEHRL